MSQKLLLGFPWKTWYYMTLDVWFVVSLIMIFRVTATSDLANLNRICCVWLCLWVPALVLLDLPSDGLALEMDRVLISYSSGCGVALLPPAVCDGLFSCWADGLFSPWSSNTAASGVLPRRCEGTWTLTSVYPSCLLSRASTLSGLASLLVLPWPFLTGDLPRSAAPPPLSDTDSREASSNRDAPFSDPAGDRWGWRARWVLCGDSAKMEIRSTEGLRERERTVQVAKLSTGTSSRGLKARDGGRWPDCWPDNRNFSNSSSSWCPCKAPGTGWRWKPPL